MGNSWLPLNIGIRVMPGYSFKSDDLGDIGDIPIVKIGNVLHGYVDLSVTQFISQDKYLEKYSKYLLNKGDVLIAMSGANVGRVGKIRECCYKIILQNQRVGRLVADSEHLDIDYVYHILRTYEYFKKLNVAGYGSAQPNLDPKTILSIEIPVPPIKNQRTIAYILNTLDDKIELNRQVNEKLEAIAQALFKSWFVDFDPVKAKAEGRDTGLPEHISSLFPASFVNSELGQIPEGWRVGSFANIIHERRDRVGNMTAKVLSAVSTGELVYSDELFNKRVYSKEIAKYLLVEPGDFAYNPARVNIGSIGVHRGDKLGAVSPVYVVFRPEPDYSEFISYQLRLNSIKIWIVTLASGSVRQSLSYKDFASIPCVIPTTEITRSFNKIQNQLSQVISGRNDENKTLEEMRDALLPKLISGELPIPDAERIVGRYL